MQLTNCIFEISNTQKQRYMIGLSNSFSADEVHKLILSGLFCNHRSENIFQLIISFPSLRTFDGILKFLSSTRCLLSLHFVDNPFNLHKPENIFLLFITAWSNHGPAGRMRIPSKDLFFLLENAMILDKNRCF